MKLVIWGWSIDRDPNHNPAPDGKYQVTIRRTDKGGKYDIRREYRDVGYTSAKRLVDAWDRMRPK